MVLPGMIDSAWGIVTQARCPTPLRACYAMSGTQIAYGALLPACYVMSGTDMAYGRSYLATSLLRHVWYSHCVWWQRADKGGELLAETLVQRSQVTCAIFLRAYPVGRPVTLVGFGMGARLIFRCLQHLAKMGAAGSATSLRATSLRALAYALLACAKAYARATPCPVLTQRGPLQTTRGCGGEGVGESGERVRAPPHQR
eukprot:3871306-Rhodomonas_salina.1